jgi:prepilin-type N-terminal cleavage/methylation domain-containing protein
VASGRYPRNLRLHKEFAGKSPDAQKERSFYRTPSFRGKERTIMKKVTYRKRAAFSLMELLAVVTILGIIAAIIVPRVTVSSDTAKQKVNSHNKATINAAVERWYIEKGAWPANNLSDIGADANYFPDGIPTNPVSGAAYALDGTTHRVQ